MGVSIDVFSSVAYVFSFDRIWNHLSQKRKMFVKVSRSASNNIHWYVSNAIIQHISIIWNWFLMLIQPPNFEATFSFLDCKRSWCILPFFSNYFKIFLITELRCLLSTIKLFYSSTIIFKVQVVSHQRTNYFPNFLK